METLSTLVPRYLEACQYERKLSLDTVKAYRIDLAQFARFAAGENWADRELLQSAYDAYTPGGREALRDIVVLELLFSTGLRVSELCSISIATTQIYTHVSTRQETLLLAGNHPRGGMSFSLRG